MIVILLNIRSKPLAFFQIKKFFLKMNIIQKEYWMNNLYFIHLKCYYHTFYIASLYVGCMISSLLSHLEKDYLKIKISSLVSTNTILKNST